MSQEVSAGIIVFYPGKEVQYLLLHYLAGHWDFPKGHIENNEDFEVTAIRETQEETGLNPELIKGFKEEISYFFNRSGLRKKTVHFFLGKVNKKVVRLSSEHIGYRWLTYDDALSVLSFKSAQDVLVKANTFLVHGRT